MGKTVYELFMEMASLESKINKLTEELGQAKDKATESRISIEIDRLYAEFLKNKHQMERIEVTIQVIHMRCKKCGKEMRIITYEDSCTYEYYQYKCSCGVKCGASIGVNDSFIEWVEEQNMEWFESYDINEFKEFCKKRNIPDNFVNFLVWKDKYMNK